MASSSQAEEKEIRIDRNLTLEKYEIGARIGTGGYGWRLNNSFEILTKIL